jgi:hypothetical protein
VQIQGWGLALTGLQRAIDQRAQEAIRARIRVVKTVAKPIRLLVRYDEAECRQFIVSATINDEGDVGQLRGDAITLGLDGSGAALRGILSALVTNM